MTGTFIFFLKISLSDGEKGFNRTQQKAKFGKHELSCLYPTVLSLLYEPLRITLVGGSLDRAHGKKWLSNFHMHQGSGEMCNLTHCQSKSKSMRGLASGQFGHASYALTGGNLWLSILVLRNLFRVLCRCWWSTAYVLALFPESWPRQTLSLCRWSLLISEREKGGRLLHLPSALREWRTRDGEEGIARGGRTFWDMRRAGSRAQRQRMWCV